MIEGVDRNYSIENNTSYSFVILAKNNKTIH